MLNRLMQLRISILFRIKNDARYVRTTFLVNWFHICMTIFVLLSVNKYIKTTFPSRPSPSDVVWVMSFLHSFLSANVIRTLLLAGENGLHVHEKLVSTFLLRTYTFVECYSQIATSCRSRLSPSWEACFYIPTYIYLRGMLFSHCY